MTDNLFTALPLPAALIANLESLDYTRMTPIQQQSLPLILEGHDLIAKAKTGSGKTAAFAIGLISKLVLKHYAPQALVLCPTRELGAQVAAEIRRLVRYQPNIKVLTLCGGQPIGPQIGSLEHGAHILVGTPGRLMDHLGRGTLSLNHIKTLVLDEADRMLDMGFRDDIEKIIRNIRGKRQTLLFSATYPPGIKKLSADFQKEPVEVKVESVLTGNKVRQLCFEVDEASRSDALIRLLEHFHPASTVIFCNTKQICRDVHDLLLKQKFSALALHGDLDQSERNQILVQFSNKSCSILVATDVAARGLDIKDLQAVINYNLFPKPDVYIHRIGRTGRVEKEGLALSLYRKKETHKLTAIAELQGFHPELKTIASLPESPATSIVPPMVTLCISGGKKQKIRPGDILGAITGEAGLPGSCVGQIDIFDFHAYVAIERKFADKALERLTNGRIKGRTLKVRPIR